MNDAQMHITDPSLLLRRAACATHQPLYGAFLHVDEPGLVQPPRMLVVGIRVDARADDTGFEEREPLERWRVASVAGVFGAEASGADVGDLEPAAGTEVREALGEEAGPVVHSIREHAGVDEVEVFVVVRWEEGPVVLHVGFGEVAVSGRAGEVLRRGEVDAQDLSGRVLLCEIEGPGAGSAAYVEHGVNV